jgi:hypothetical protein
MTISRTGNRTLASACIGAGMLFGLTGCVSNSDDKGTGGSGGGGSTAMGGSTSTGGASATGGSGGGSATMGFACPKPKVPLISDFSMTAEGKTDTVSFGDFTTTFSGGTFHYPNMGTYALVADVTGGNWNLSGSVGDYSGMGLFFSGPDPDGVVGGCSLVDASAYKGLKFTISGSVPMGNSVTLRVGTAATDVSAAWLNAHKAVPTEADKPANLSRCMPATGQYDGTCEAPSKTIPVTATPTLVTVPWAELLGGKPQAGVDPKEIVFISFILPNPAGAGTTAPTPYTVDVTIDDLAFIE